MSETTPTPAVQPDNQPATGQPTTGQPAGGDRPAERGPDYATAAAVAGLAREVEALRRGVAQLAGLPRRVQEVADLVARLAEQVSASGLPAEDQGTVTWLDLPQQHPQPDYTTPAEVEAEVQLARLVSWMGDVYLRYGDAVKGLPGCWLWHPDVVEELCWLRQAWLAAYTDPEAKVSAAGDWHDRQRPGVVRRIQAYAGVCSIEQHTDGGDRHAYPVLVPLAEAATTISTWWATRRAGLPPVPTPEQVSAGMPARTARGRR
jgi:hypothetical protein